MYGQVDNAETSKRSAAERAELFAKMNAAFNESKGYIRQSLSAGESLKYLLHALPIPCIQSKLRLLRATRPYDVSLS